MKEKIITTYTLEAYFVGKLRGNGNYRTITIKHSNTEII